MDKNIIIKLKVSSKLNIIYFSFSDKKNFLDY